MKLLIAGSRTIEISNSELSLLIHKYDLMETEIVSGGAIGIDTCAINWAKEVGIQHTIFYPGWKQHGKFYAAYVRNNKMANYADILLAIWDGKSRGTKHMIDAMRELGKPVYVEILKDKKT